MRIGIASGTYYPWFGGITEHTAGSDAALRALGHETYVLTAGPPRAGVSAHVLSVARRVTIPWHGASAGLSFGWRLSSRLESMYRRLRLDLVHVHEPLVPGLAIAAVLAASRCGVPVVGTFHAAAERDLPYLLAGPLLRRVAKRLDLRIAVSEAARALAARYFPGAYQIVPNGVDVARFHPDVQPAPLGPGGPVVVCVGRLDPRKGVAHLIDALPALAASCPDVRLVLVGDGPLRAALERRARRVAPGRVRFVSSVPPEEVAGYYKAADVVCCPATHNESFGIVILEALACGRPVVASDLPGYRVPLRDGASGRLVPPARPAALAEALGEILARPDLAKRMSARARATALEYDWHRVGEALQRCYETVVRQPRVYATDGIGR